MASMAMLVITRGFFVDGIHGTPYMAAPFSDPSWVMVIPEDLDDNWGTTWLPVTLWLCQKI